MGRIALVSRPRATLFSRFATGYQYAAWRVTGIRCPIDFDWRAAQKGKGRNGDVETVSVKAELDAHVAAVRAAVKAGDGAGLARAVDAVPERFRRPVEARLGVPGFITEGRWRAACASMRGR